MSDQESKTRTITLTGRAPVQIREDVSMEPKVEITAWGLKHGPPPAADVVFDVRWARNPYYVPEMRDLTGFDEEVRAHVMGDPDARVMATALLRAPILVRAHAMGDPDARRGLRAARRAVLLKLRWQRRARVVVCCTGGRHRSVAFASELARSLALEIGEVVPVHAPHAESGVS